MLDPFPIPAPKWVIELMLPFCEALSLPSLTLHAHEAILACGLYTFLYLVVAPIISVRIWPKTYKAFNRRTKVNWDVHIVSFFQSTMISILCFWIMFKDEQRERMNDWDAWEERIWAYTGANGFLQSLGLGYFLWDLFMCAYHIKIFGVGMLAHAICAITVFAFGYRPFVYYYAPNFLLYELSSPFLNIHWFCDKLNLTGSVYQAVNGIFLVSTFFGCRLIWGVMSSFKVFYDIYKATTMGRVSLTAPSVPTILEAETLMAISKDAEAQIWFFTGSEFIPVWLGIVYLSANIVLNTLNFYWFEKMIATIRKRFDPPFGTKGVGADVIHWEPQEKPKTKGSVKAGRERAEEALNGSTTVQDNAQVSKAAHADVSTGTDYAGQKAPRTRRKA